ncbi:bifunctional purine biosynthesis protein PurH-like [Ylistrum balloti]|uniref:bifunctional purine biosynthesis protein PurH-like n=1 Tax=Ylistrum balloti TaxID=509963 RepID=UPI002905ACB9|nr:bifunctional purine biosynthesis protein PurH-like [Ylistrum balloti]
MDNNALALISVSDKNSLETLCLGLLDLGYTIVSTEGTAAYLSSKGIASLLISSVTNFESILHGRVKTLDPKIFAGILARHDQKTDMQDLQKISAKPISVVVVNPYPFQKCIEAKHTITDAIEHIDIGGLALLRAAAKNHQSVLAISDPRDYDTALYHLQALSVGRSMNDAQMIKAAEKDFLEFKVEQAQKAFSMASCYDAQVAEYFTHSISKNAKKKQVKFPAQLHLSLTKHSELRYGENPQQEAAIYRHSVAHSTSVLDARQLHGKELSYNNYRDAQAALDIALEFDESVAVGVKHGNPCAVAVAKNSAEAWKLAYKADPVSIFGGIVAINTELTTELASSLSALFLEIIIAPKYTREALAILKKKSSLRLLSIPFRTRKKHSFDYQSLPGAIMVQDHDNTSLSERNIECVTKKKAGRKELEDLLFAWKIVKHVKSNAIVVAKQKCTYGIGAGQMSRVQSVQLALAQAEKLGRARNAVMASDAFFPMPDSIELAAQSNIKAIIQPGGSIRDAQCIEVCNIHNIAMLCTRTRHFLH